MLVKCCIRCKSKKVAHFSHVKVVSVSFFWLCFRVFPCKENLKGQLFPRRGSKNSVLFGKNTWIEMVYLNSSRSLFKGWRLADGRGKETTSIHICHVCFVLTYIQDLTLKSFQGEKRLFCARVNHCTNELRVCCQNAGILLTEINPSHRSHII